MRVLVLLSSNPGDGLLVKLHNEKLVREVRNSIARRDHSKAMVTALTKGRIECEVGHDQVHKIDAELILTKDRACWNIMK